MLKITELAEVLRVHVRTLRDWLKKGMPHYKVGNTLRFDLEEVKEWMKNQNG